MKESMTMVREESALSHPNPSHSPTPPTPPPIILGVAAAEDQWLRNLVYGLMVLAGISASMLLGMVLFSFRQPVAADPWTQPLETQATAAIDFPLPEFSLLDQHANPIQKQDLRGKVWVASFIFTRCHDSCPLVSAVIDHLYDTMPAKTHFLTITVDPRYDQPEILQAYAQNFDADDQRWRFVTGMPDKVYQLLREGFKVPVQENPDGRSLGQELVVHTSRLALIDEQGTIRGYYESRDQAAVQRLKRDLLELLNHPSRQVVHLPAK